MARDGRSNLPLLDFDSTDLLRSEEFLSQAYGKLRLSGAGEKTRTRIRRYSLASIDIDDNLVEWDLHYEVSEAIGKVCFCTGIRTGGITRRYEDGAEETFGPGDAFFYTPHDQTYAGAHHHADCDLVMFDHELLDQVVGPRRGGGAEPIRFTGDRPTSAAAAEVFRDTVAHIRDRVMTDPASAASPLIVSNVSQLLAAVALHAFPNDAVVDAAVADRRDAHAATMRRAVAYIDAHAGEPITLGDIATAAGASGRGLWEAFRRQADTTPLEYLQRVRLDGAHRDLLATGTDAEGAVPAIAARWGFRSLGRFDYLHRREYGTSAVDAGAPRGAGG
jgi:AraC-like DNA-binding protein